MTTIDKQQELMDILADKKRIQFTVRTTKPAVQYDDYTVQIEPKHIVYLDNTKDIDIQATFENAGILDADHIQSQAVYMPLSQKRAKMLVEDGTDIDDYIRKYKNATVLGHNTEYDSTWDEETTHYEDTYSFGPQEQRDYNSKIQQFRDYYTAEKKLKK